MEKIKSKKEAKEVKLKEQKIEEQILKVLEDAKLKTTEEKLQLLLSKYVENERNNRRLTQELKMHEKQLESIMREKEILQREFNKNLLMRDKLAQVCREQQKLIKSVKNESMQKIREEEEKRKESQTKFQTSLNEITQSLNKNNEENNKLRDHNIEMTKKLKYLADQYEVREEQMEKLNEQVQLESQLHQAKLSKIQMEAAMEKEILIKEKQIALERLIHTQKTLQELSEREKCLKEQLHLYTTKYDDFQSSLQKSNNIFATYKTELEKMSKNTRKLEKESLEWKRKWEKSNATLIELATEKKDRDEHAVRCNKQVEQLQKLLRALQSERTHLYKVIKDNNMELPPLPALPPEPEPLKVTPITNVADKDKMEVMSRNCAELKMTLANLQNQMKYLNMKGAEAEEQCRQLQAQEETIKKKQKKKPKSRKSSITNSKSAAAASTAAATSNADTNDKADDQQQQQEETAADNCLQPLVEAAVMKLVEEPDLDEAVITSEVIETPLETMEPMEAVITASEVIKTPLEIMEPMEAVITATEVIKTPLETMEPMEAVITDTEVIKTPLETMEPMEAVITASEVIKTPLEIMEPMEAVITATEVIKTPLETMNPMEAVIAATEVIKAPLETMEPIEAVITATEVIETPLETMKIMEPN